MEIVNIKIEEIKPYKNNAKKHDQTQIDNVAQSITEFGFQQPLVLDLDNVIIIGHCRFAAAQKLGLQEVPCVYFQSKDKKKINKLRLLDNKLNESEWDFDLLHQDLDGLDFSEYEIDFGVEVDAPEPINEIIEDEEPKEVQTRCKLGDIYILGNHRLICGDSTKQEYIEKLMNGEKADLFLTDPPYNVNYNGETKRKTDRTIKNDNMDDISFYNFLYDSFTVADNNIKNGASFYIWHSDSESVNFRCACCDIGWKIRECLIWNKNTFTLGRLDYHYKHEPCLYGWKDGAAHYFVNSRKESTVIQDEEEIKPERMSKQELVDLVKNILNKESTTIINENKPIKSDLHPTMKPIKLLAYLIANSSKQKWVVLDLFGGSGSTLIACEQLNRKCYMCELDEHYCDVIIQRWENFTGQKAVFLENILTNK